MIALALAMALSVTAETPATTELPSPPPAAARKPATTVGQTRADPERIICRKDKRSNSRLPTKVCKTAAEWDVDTETAREAVREIQSAPRTN